MQNLSVPGRSHERAVIEGLELQLVRSGAREQVASISPFGDGHSGVTYAVEFAHRGRAILRLSPPGVRLAGPADIGRQGRIMSALGARGLPVPPVIAYDSGPVIDGRSFALTDFVAGVTWAAVARRYSHRAVASAAVDALRRIQDVPAGATGLAGEQVTTPGQELARWEALLRRASREQRLAGESFASALGNATPAAGGAVLVHGDYHYGNLIFAKDRVVAVVDWEIAELGDPLMDLGCLAVASLRRRYQPDPNPTGDVDIELVELVDLYGATPDRAAWFIALSCFKYAAILAYNLQLHRSGKKLDDVYEHLQRTAMGLLRDGQTVLESGVGSVRRRSETA